MVRLSNEMVRDGMVESWYGMVQIRKRKTKNVSEKEDHRAGVREEKNKDRREHYRYPPFQMWGRNENVQPTTAKRDQSWVVSMYDRPIEPKTKKQITKDLLTPRHVVEPKRAKKKVASRQPEPGETFLLR